MTMNPQPKLPVEYVSDKLGLDDVFRDAKPLGDGSDWTLLGFFASDEELDEFQLWLKAERAAGLASPDADRPRHGRSVRPHQEHDRPGSEPSSRCDASAIGCVLVDLLCDARRRWAIGAQSENLFDELSVQLLRDLAGRSRCDG